MNFTQIKEAQNGWMTNHGFVPDNDSIHTCRELKKAIAAAISIAEQIEEIIQSDNEMA